FDCVRNLAEAQQPYLAVAAIDLGANVVFLTIFGAPSLLNRLLHRFQHLVAIDAFVASNGIGDLQQFGTGVSNGPFHWALGFCRLVCGRQCFCGRRWGWDGAGCRVLRRAAVSKSSVKTSLARATEASGNCISPFSVARRRLLPEVPSSRPRKRLRPSIGRASS